MKVKRFLCFIFLVSLFVTCVYTQEREDMSLFEIDRLIRKTEYDEALRQLNTYIELHPDNFDNAQTRVRRIMNARKQYSILAEKLIALILTDPGNDKEIYEITARLEKFERHPSDQNLQFIADLKKSAEFNYFRAQFLEIQTQTAELSHKGNFVAAIEKAKEGFWLYQDDFYEKWEDNPEITGAVDKIIADLNSFIATYEEKTFLQRTRDAVDEFVKAVNQDQYDLAMTRFSAVRDAFDRYNNVRHQFVENGRQMQSKFSEIQALDSDVTDASYLPFMIRFVYGIDSIPDSGILGAVDAQWNDLEGKMNDALYKAISKKYDVYKKGISNLFATDVRKYVNLENNVLDLYKITEKDKEYALANPYNDYYTIGEYVKQLSEIVVALNEKNTKIQNLAKSQQNILSKIQEDISAEEKGKYAAELFNSNSNIGTIVGLKENQKLSRFDWANNYSLLERSEWSGLTDVYNEMLDSMFVQSEELITGSWQEITRYYKLCSNNLYSNIQDDNKASKSFIDGFITKIPSSVVAEINGNIERAVAYEKNYVADPDMDFGIKYSYPNIALNLSSYTQRQIEKYIVEIDGYLNVIKSNYMSNEQWRNNEQVTEIVEAAEQYLQTRQKDLAALKTTASSHMALAQSKISASQIAKNEADIRFNEAENALRKDDFEVARKKLQDALSKYDEALDAQNDDKLRLDVDTKLQSLGERIAKAENEIVVREVRNLKTQAKDAYFNGRFDDAEKLLNQAKIRWAVTNVQEDEEITNLLNFVNTAISMKTGRDIVPSAPQYPEMSQLLNLAYQYFDEGSRKIGDGYKDDGIKDLDTALENIQKVQYVYPLNQEAAILTLRINRLKDPAKFRSEFAQKIEMAKMMVKSSETRQEGYANLLDYYELDPNYKGLKDLIYQTEIDIGIRQKPVDNSGEKKAQRYIADAQKLYDSAGNDEKKLKQALEKVDQALAVLPDNRTAMNLKDKITTKIGGNASQVISTEDERLYQLAIQRLQNNNVVGANAIVEQLMKKPVNANSQKIKDLKNKIDARS